MTAVLKYLLPLFILFLISCSNTRHLPPGDALYTGASVKITDEGAPAKVKRELQGNLAAITRPKPNTKFLGMRLKLSIFNMAGNPNKSNFIRKAFRKFG